MNPTQSWPAVARIWWLRFLDRVKPRPGIGGPSPRISVATPAEAERIKQILCDHPPPAEWIYIDRESEDTYTGYCERCPKCGEIRQVPQ